MKTIYEGSRLKVCIPNTRTEFVSALLSCVAIYLLIAGKPSEGLEMLQLALLFEILGRPPEKEA